MKQILSKIEVHTWIIGAEIRSVALMMVENEHVEECREFIKTESLFTVLNPRGETHTAIYIFKYPCMEDVINFTLGEFYDQKVVRRWIEGKMFGYPDEKISKFIEDR